MSRPRRFILTANRDLPELGLRCGNVEIPITAGAQIIVDRRHPIGPVTVGNLSIADPEVLRKLSRMVFLSRPGMLARPGNRSEAGGELPPFTVTPSYIGAQWTLENIHAELMGWTDSAEKRATERRARQQAVREALAAPLEVAPREPHAAALLGMSAWSRLANWLESIRGEPA
jgi:hypothetical protein